MEKGNLINAFFSGAVNWKHAMCQSLPSTFDLFLLKCIEPLQTPHITVLQLSEENVYFCLGFPYIKCAVFQCKVISYLWNINPWGKYFRIHCCQSCRAGISKLSFTRTLFTHLLHTFWQYSRGVRRVGDQNIDTILVQCLKAGRVLDYGYWPSFNL